MACQLDGKQVSLIRDSFPGEGAVGIGTERFVQLKGWKHGVPGAGLWCSSEDPAWAVHTLHRNIWL